MEPGPVPTSAKRSGQRAAVSAVATDLPRVASSRRAYRGGGHVGAGIGGPGWRPPRQWDAVGAPRFRAVNHAPRLWVLAAERLPERWPRNSVVGLHWPRLPIDPQLARRAGVAHPQRDVRPTTRLRGFGGPLLAAQPWRECRSIAAVAAGEQPRTLRRPRSALCCSAPRSLARGDTRSRMSSSSRGSLIAPRWSLPA